MTSPVNLSRSASPIPMGDHANDAPEGQSAAGSSTTPSKPTSAPHLSTLTSGRRGSAVFLVTQPEHAAASVRRVAGDPNALNDQGNTLLIQAVRDGDLQAFNRLLEDDRVDVNKPDELHNSPLLLACMGTSPFSIGKLKAKFLRDKLLKKPGINVNAANIDGITPLHMACRENALGTVRALLKVDGIAINAKDNEGRTPLDFAVDAGNEEIMAALFEHGGVDVHETDEDNRTLLHRLIEHRFKKAIPALLALAPDLASTGDNFGITPLHEAAEIENADILRMLLAQKGVNVNATDAEDRTPLHYAIWEGHTANVEALLGQEEVNVNAIDANGRTPLHYAIWNGHTDAAKALLENERVNINAVDKDDATPLHYAAVISRVEIGELLLERGDLDLSLKTKNGSTAFYAAVDRSPSLALAMLAVRYGLNENGMLAEKALRPDDPDVNGITPLQVALTRATNRATNPVTVSNDPERRSLFAQLLNDPRVDSNQLLSVIRHTPTHTWEMVLHNLGILGFERSTDSLLKVLHQWANKRPVGVRQNQALAAKTNFYLGQLYHLGEARMNGLSDDEKLRLQSKAVFHHTLALEQLMKHPEQSERRMGRNHTETVDGTDSISNYAKKLLTAVTEEDRLQLRATEPPAHAIWSKRTEPFPFRHPEKHTGDQFIPTLEQTEYILADDVAPTDAVNISGICVPRADIADLANGRGYKATQLALLVDDVDPELRNAHQIGHLMMGVVMLDAVRNKNAETLVRLNDASSSAAEAQPHAALAFPVAVEQVRAAIATAREAPALNEPQSETKEARLARLARVALLAEAAAAIDVLARMPADLVVHERELTATVQSVFREMWFYIQNSPDEMRENLEEALFDQLADMWDRRLPDRRFVCAIGCVQRLLSVPHHIDPSLMTSTLNLSSLEMITALRELAKDVLRPIHSAYYLAGTPGLLDEDDHVELEKEIFEVAAREIMIGYRGWEDSPKVHEAIEAVKENLEYIDVVAEDTQEA